ncbi:MAG: hypothetical protein O3A95_08325 [Planctomycetota bacterium]|nr:hypothetical protein [Planctomycetota bacterium]MDA1114287.1 hypothetical protein [Planctomycetota bacterium]
MTKQRWSWQAESKQEGKVILFRFELHAVEATFADAIHALQMDPEFRSMLIKILADCPFTALRWETPMLTTELLNRRFEFVLLDSPYLDVPANAWDFQEYFDAAPNAGAVSFWNLGHDGIMVAPTPQQAPPAYAHLAAFSRFAPETQQHEFWNLVGEVLEERLSLQPVWLSTAGGGVDWLHVRLDNQPKYYGYAAFAQPS